MNYFTEIIRSSMSRAGRMRVKSALNPFLWACLIVPPLCWAAAYNFQFDFLIYRIMMFSGISPIFLLVVGGLYFIFRDPARLQSEDYQIKQQTLSLIEKKGGKIVISPEALVEISNPAPNQIEHRGE